MRNISIAFALAFATACGIKDSTPITELTVEDWQAECENTDQPVKTVTCDVSGTSVDVEVGGSVEDCQESVSELPEWTADCAATMGDYRACSQAMYDDPCALMTGTPTECEAFFACIPME